jgi:hypothetical protein
MATSAGDGLPRPVPGHQPDQVHGENEERQRVNQDDERQPGQAEQQLAALTPVERRHDRRAGNRPRFLTRAWPPGGGSAVGVVTGRPMPPFSSLPALPSAHASRRASSHPPTASAITAYRHSTPSPAHADKKCGAGRAVRAAGHRLGRAQRVLHDQDRHVRRRAVHDKADDLRDHVYAGHQHPNRGRAVPDDRAQAQAEQPDQAEAAP